MSNQNYYIFYSKEGVVMMWGSLVLGYFRSHLSLWGHHLIRVRRFSQVHKV